MAERSCTTKVWVGIFEKMAQVHGMVDVRGAHFVFALECPLCAQFVWFGSRSAVSNVCWYSFLLLFTYSVCVILYVCACVCNVYVVSVCAQVQCVLCDTHEPLHIWKSASVQSVHITGGSWVASSRRSYSVCAINTDRYTACYCALMCDVCGTERVFRLAVRRWFEEI